MEAATPLQEFLFEFHQSLHRDDINRSIVIEFDNAKILPQIRSSTFTTGKDRSRWESSANEVPAAAEATSPTRRGVTRSLSPQKPQRRGSIEMPKTALPPRKPQRPAASPVKSPNTRRVRILLRTLTPRKPQRRTSIGDLDAVTIKEQQEEEAFGRCSPTAALEAAAPIKVAPSAA